jgi:uroporphyrinogen decarboxylase
VTSREIIRRVLERDSPPRIGLTFSAYDGQPRLHDVTGAGPSGSPSFQERRWMDEEGGECWTDEWGCVWRRIPGKTKGGECVEAPIKTWADLDTYRMPSVDDPTRYERAAQAFEADAEHYRLGSIAACAFNLARYLRRMDLYLLDCAADPEQIRRLNRMVSDLVIGQVGLWADAGADGVFFCEDWGTQDRLLVSPRMWREMFRPDFERLINHAHRRGLTVWMHSCGCIRDIVPDLVELGMDVLQFDQPDLHGIDELAAFHDRVTYWCPVDIQTTLQSGSEATIRAKAREMVEKLGRRGGLIAKDYPDDFSIGADPIWQQWAYEEFVATGASR